MRATFLSLICVALLLPACSTSTEKSTISAANKKAPNENETVKPEKKKEEDSAEEVTKVSATVVEEWGTIKGRILVVGDVPTPTRVEVTKDAEVCGAKDPIFDNSLVVSKDGGLQNAFLFLYKSTRDPQEPKIHPSYEESAEATLEVDNVNCIFVPHVLAMRTSQKLLAKNSDPKGHNVQNNSRVNPFNPLIPPKGEIELEMEGAEKLPTKLTCNIHPWMTGYMIVRDDPYVAITDENGNFEIKNMPEGEWKFQFWHERVGYMANLEKDGKPLMEGRPVTFTVAITNGETVDLGELKIAADALKGDE